MKYYYKKYGSGIFRPVIPVEIVFGNKHVRYEALIDSGADECIFDAQIADILDIKLPKGEKKIIGGITGDEQFYWAHSVKIIIGGWEYDIRAGFMPKMPTYRYGVLGQKGFFEYFVVKFDYSKLEIELKADVNN